MNEVHFGIAVVAAFALIIGGFMYTDYDLKVRCFEAGGVWADSSCEREAGQ